MGDLVRGRDSSGPGVDPGGPLVERLWPQIEDIFFTASPRQDFPNSAARCKFFEDWTGYYREKASDRIFLSFQGGEMTGYLMGCFDSLSAADFFQALPVYRVFEDLFDAYPAHFHINCREDHQSKGQGSALVAAFLAACRKADASGAIPGVHVVSAPGAPNLGFYRRLGFEEIARRPHDGRERLFMGMAL